jgi:peptidoglycan hydrolase CwlO-like protein
MKTTVIFLIFVLCLSNYITAQDAFAKIKSALYNFRDSINTEQNDADLRHKQEVQWCGKAITYAQRTLTQRTKDVNDIAAHIKYLQNEITQTTNDRNSRQDRIKQNNLTLERFKKERCENNLNYIKSLREHKESIDILKLLRADLQTYFNNWLKNPTRPNKLAASAFIEKMSRFAHLFDDEHRNIFIQLVESMKSLSKRDSVAALHKNVDSYTSTRARTAGQIGTKHVDNNRGELKKLEAPAVVEAREYVIALRSKTLLMIDSLIKHLETSRRKLSEDEMLANEHFADFQAQMFKENAYLAEKVAEDNKLLLSLNVQLTKAQGQHSRREKLRLEAEENLRALQRQCKEKNDYYTRENNRRKNELSITAKAINTYNGIVSRIQARIASRVSSNYSGAKQYQSKDINENNVVSYAPNVDSGVGQNVRQRNQVAL